MSDTHAAVEAVWRIESGRLVAMLARITGDFAGAEDLAQDALERALTQWPTHGIPQHPASWLMATAKHIAVDRYRRQLNLVDKLAAIAHEPITALSTEGDPMATVDDGLAASVPDDLLRLIFTACHPALSLDSQVALTLRTVAGLRTPEIARAFLVPEATIGQRISRAKRTLTDKQVRFELPSALDLPSRLGAVLAVIYLVFNEGYSATAGDDWTRPALCHDALRLGRVLARLQPDEPEVHGLLALMELQASRIPARSGPAGEQLLLADQNRRRWDRLHIRRGLTALQAAETLGGGPYTVQAAIAACHARAPGIDATDWARVSALYTVLSYLSPSAVVSLNKAVAVGMADGPERGLALADELQTHPALVAYPALSAVRATFLRQLGRPDEARAAFQQAADLTSNVSQRAIYQRQRDNPAPHVPKAAP